MLAALKEIGPAMIRWGGNFVSGYEWRDGIGDPDKRPSRYDYAWRAMETNDAGTDEFLALTSFLGAESADGAFERRDPARAVPEFGLVPDGGVHALDGIAQIQPDRYELAGTSHRLAEDARSQANRSGGWLHFAN